MLLTSVIQMETLLDLYEEYANRQQINDYAKDLIFCGMNTDIMYHIKQKLSILQLYLQLQVTNENEVND